MKNKCSAEKKRLSVTKFIQRVQTSSLNAGATTQGASCPCGGGSSVLRFHSKHEIVLH